MQLTVHLAEREYAVEDEKGILLMESPAQKIKMEHSLVTISKWEAKYHKSFMNCKNKTPEEMEYYIRCMIVDPDFGEPEDIDNFLIHRILTENDYYKRICAYLEDKMCATYLREDPDQKKNTEVITAELIYYWMVKLEMPVELFEHWHINRLLTEIEVFGRKDAPKKHRSMSSIMRENNALNEARKKQLGTRG